MPPKPDKASLIAKADLATSTRESAEKRVAELAAELEAARQQHTDATAAEEKAHAEAFAEERAASAAEAKANHERHHQEHAAHRASIAARRTAREKAEPSPIDHTSLKVMTIDGKTHEIVAAHGLMLGHHGFGDKARDASRYTAACGLSVDAAHDELDHERFEQQAAPNCPACKQALLEMDNGERKDLRSDYLTADEQLAFAREQNKRRNAAVSAPEPEPS